MMGNSSEAEAVITMAAYIGGGGLLFSVNVSREGNPGFSRTSTFLVFVQKSFTCDFLFAAKMLHNNPPFFL